MRSSVAPEPQMARQPRLTSLIGFQLRRVSTQSLAALEISLADLGLRVGHYAVLSAMEAEPGTTQNQICQAIKVRPANLTPVVNELERRGLVLRQRDLKDKRVARVRLSPAGQALMGELHRRVLEHEARFYAALAPDEKAALMALLDRLGAP